MRDKHNKRRVTCYLYCIKLVYLTFFFLCWISSDGDDDGLPWNKVSCRDSSFSSTTPITVAGSWRVKLIWISVSKWMPGYVCWISFSTCLMWRRHKGFITWLPIQRRICGRGWSAFVRCVGCRRRHALEHHLTYSVSVIVVESLCF